MRIASLITVLALVGFALACGGSAEVDEPVPVTNPADIEGHGELGGDDPFTQYVNSSYQYCDAKVLGALWGEDTYEAKSSIGRMLRAGESDLIEQKLSGSRQRALEDLDNREIRCHYDELGVSFDDVMALSAFWGVDTWEAKMRVEEKFLRDGHDDQYVRAAIRDAHAAAGPGH